MSRSEVDFHFALPCFCWALPSKAGRSGAQKAQSPRLHISSTLADEIKAIAPTIRLPQIVSAMWDLTPID